MNRTEAGNQSRGPEKEPTTIAASTRRLGAWLFLVAGVLLGCAHSENEFRVATVGGLTPTPPPFLNGPAALLLTNASGYSAEVTMQMDPGNPKTAIRGQLLCRGAQLLFAPAEETGRKLMHPGISFIWNVAENRGYLLSETLQGYAPVSSQARFTGMDIKPGAPASEKIGGHTCVQAQAIVTAAEGGLSGFHVWQATDLNGFPIRIISANSSVPVDLTLSRIRLEAPSPELFAPPASFSRYSSPEALMTEMTLRHQNLRRRVPNDFTMPEGVEHPEQDRR